MKKYDESDINIDSLMSEIGSKVPTMIQLQDNGCIYWTGTTTKKKATKDSYRDEGYLAVQKPINVISAKRAVWFLSRGFFFNGRLSTTCGDVFCVNADHQKLHTNSGHHKTPAKELAMNADPEWKTAAELYFQQNLL